MKYYIELLEDNQTNNGEKSVVYYNGSLEYSNNKDGNRFIIAITSDTKLEIGDVYSFSDSMYGAQLMYSIADEDEQDRCNNHTTISKLSHKVLALSIGFYDVTRLPEHFIIKFIEFYNTNNKFMQINDDAEYESIFIK